MIIIHAECKGEGNKEGTTRIEGKDFNVFDMLNLYCNITAAVVTGIKEHMQDAPDAVVNYLMRSAFEKAMKVQLEQSSDS